MTFGAEKIPLGINIKFDIAEFLKGKFSNDAIAVSEILLKTDDKLNSFKDKLFELVKEAGPDEINELLEG